MHPYAGMVIYLALAAVVAVLFILLSVWLGPKKRALAEPFECGVEPIGLPSGRISVKFYLIAVLFIIFDVELIFIFPWAVLYRTLGVVGFIEMFIFLAILMVGFIYAWKKGALEWE